jgi:hypothetical protein
MAHFAELDKDNKVIRVVVACNIDIANNGGELSEQAAEHFKIVCPLSENGVKWIQTSYNSNFRKQPACIGFSYDPVKDVFISIKPYSSWVLNQNNDWEAPIPYPSITTYGDGFQYKFIRWNEENMCWIGYDHEEPSNTFKWLPESKSWITIII